MLEEVELSTWCGDTSKLLKSVLWVWNGAQREPDDQRIKAVIGEGEVAGIGGNQADRNRALPGAANRTVEHAAMIVDTDYTVGLAVVGDVEASANSDLEYPTGRRFAQTGPLVAKTEAVLGNH